jgi:hypothetical protein
MGNMTEEDNSDNRDRALGLSPAQVAGSALAAVSSAVVASTAGTAGTLIGAGVGSVIATVGAAIYTWWLRRTHETAKRVAARARQAALATQPLPRTVAQGPLRSRKDRAAAEQGGTTGKTPAERAADDAEEGEQPGFTLPWGKVLIAAALVAVIALATITLIEGLTGKPVSSLTGGSDSTGTSVGHLVGSDDEPEKPAEDKSPTPEPTVEPNSQGTDEPVPTPSVSVEPEPEPQPGEVTETPSAPVPTETADQPTEP